MLDVEEWKIIIIQRESEGIVPPTEIEREEQCRRILKK